MNCRHYRMICKLVGIIQLLLSYVFYYLLLFSKVSMLFDSKVVVLCSIKATVKLSIRRKMKKKEVDYILTTRDFKQPKIKRVIKEVLKHNSFTAIDFEFLKRFPRFLHKKNIAS